MEKPYDVGPGDKVHPGNPVTVDRYTTAARINHWITAASLVLLAISGLSLFHPKLFFLTAAVRWRGDYARHPSLDRRGAVLRFPRTIPALLEGQSVEARGWDLDGAPARCAGRHEERLPEVGKYNAGQKMVFWLMSVLIIILISSGLVIWDQYFSQYTSVEQKRAAVLIHSLAAIVIICVWIVHVYAAIWVRGTIRAMVKGSVTGGWAWRHHRKWLRELVTGKRDDQGTGAKPAE